MPTRQPVVERSRPLCGLSDAGSCQRRSGRSTWGGTGALVALILATAWTLVYTTRQSQRLAEMQIDFVAGVSHELRTPLAVICTAAYNLRGKIASNPTQVERYGVLIQQESEKLTALVEQVLHYASSRVGRSTQAAHEPGADPAGLGAAARGSGRPAQHCTGDGRRGSSGAAACERQTECEGADRRALRPGFFPGDRQPRRRPAPCRPAACAC